MNQILSENRSQRLYLWDNMRLLLIFLVVLGHFAEYYVNTSSKLRALFLFIYIFHMPAFVFISGLFSKKNINQKRYNNIFSYLILYLLIKVFYFLIGILINHTYEFHLFVESGLPWYAFSLFIFSIVSIFVTKFDKKYVIIFFVVIGCLIGYDKNIGDTFVLMRTIVYYPFFLIGYYLDQKELIKKVKSKKYFIISSIFLILLFVFVFLNIERIYWIRPMLTGRNSYFKLENCYEVAYFLRFLYYILVILIIFSFISIIPNISFFFTYLGSRTVQVYAIHNIIIKIFFNLFNGKQLLKTLGGDYSSYLIIPLSIMIVFLCSTSFFKKFFDKLLNVPRIDKV